MVRIISPPWVLCVCFKPRHTAIGLLLLLALGAALALPAQAQTEDIAPPVLDSIRVESPRHIRLYYNENLSSNTASASAFTLIASGDTLRADRASISGEKYSLRLEHTLHNRIFEGETVTLSYADPTTGNDEYAIQDAAGNDAASFTDRTAANYSGVTLKFPDAPTNLTATRNGSSQIDLSWTAEWGRKSSGYKIEASTNAGRTWQVVVANTGDRTTTYSHTGLSDGTTYDYRVSAINAAGVGDPATTVDNTPPVFDKIEMSNSNYLSIYYNENLSSTTAETSAFTLIANGDTLDLFHVQVFDKRVALALDGGFQNEMFQGESVTLSYTDPTGGDDTHAIQNYVGLDAPSFRNKVVPNISTAIPSPPKPPRRFAATAQGSSQIDLSWTAPPGRNISGYKIEVSRNEGVDWEDIIANTGSGDTVYEHSDLSYGTRYDYRVSAINAGGVGDASDVAHATTMATVPDIPQNLEATPGDGEVTLAWEAPASNGGASIDRYEYRVDGAGEWTSTDTTLSAVVSDLTNDVSYDFEVQAVNSAGAGAAATVTATPAVTIQSPSAPQNLEATPGDGEVTLAWEAPASNGGASIDRYEYRVDGAGEWTSTGTTLSAVVSDLTNDVSYDFEVQAVNSAGAGAAATVTATPAVTIQSPSAPQNLEATPGDGEVTLAWEAPASNGGASIDRYEYRVDGAGEWTSTGTTLSAVVSDLTNGTSYDFEVQAVNSAGAGAAATVTATPTIAIRSPSAPQNLKATPGDGEVTLDWETPASNGGASIDRYEYRVDDAGEWTSTGMTLSAVASDLTNGTSYNFEVKAMNSAGAGAAATVTAMPDVTIQSPSAPQNLEATPGDGEVTLAWEAPANNGGASIDRYEYRVDGAGEWTSTGTTLSTVASDLTNGTSYDFEVQAVNSAGAGAAATVTATPAVTIQSPSAPQNLRATPGDGEVTLDWEAPASNGGASIDRYEYRVDEAGEWTSTGTTLSAVVSDLTNDVSYDFEVQAVNSAGAGAAATVTATPAVTIQSPSAPQNLEATPGDGEVTLAWETPASNGGASIDHYEYRHRQSNHIFGSTASASWSDIPGEANARSYTVTGLTSGVEYTFEVRAENAQGGGTPASATVTLPEPNVESGGDTSVNTESEEIPTELTLMGNYPNPFNPQTTIDYALPQASHVRIAVYDMTGKTVAVLIDGVQPQGRHTARFHADGLPTGTYVYRLTAGAETRTRTMTLVR